MDQNQIDKPEGALLGRCGASWRSASGPIPTLGTQALGESAHQING
jgi:hypothetical protein